MRNEAKELLEKSDKELARLKVIFKSKIKIYKEKKKCLKRGKE